MRHFFAILLLLFVPSGKEAAAQQALQPFRLSGPTQGTTYQILYYAREEKVTKQEIEKLLEEVDQSMSLYRDRSLITQFNRSDKGIHIDKHLRKVLRQSFLVYKDTNGAFDMTVAPLVQAWGFGPTSIHTFPDEEDIRRLIETTGMEKVYWKGNFLGKKHPSTQIDLNGIAQGYSVDLLFKYLQKRGLRHLMVEIGGEIRMKGRKPDRSFFKVGIEEPVQDRQGESVIKRVVSFPKGAITTSGSYSRYLKYGDTYISHLINPKTGKPLQTDLISVTVYAKRAMIADGYDNALMAMGMKGAMDFLKKKKGMEAYLIYKNPEGKIADTLTKGWKDKWLYQLPIQQ